MSPDYHLQLARDLIAARLDNEDPQTSIDTARSVMERVGTWSTLQRRLPHPTLVTVPHAGHRYSGWLTALAFLDLIELDKVNPSHFLWVCHAGECSRDHSFAQPFSIWKRLSDVVPIPAKDASDVESPRMMIVSTDFSHANSDQPIRKTHREVLQSDMQAVKCISGREHHLRQIAYQDKHSIPCGWRSLAIGAEHVNKDAAWDFAGYAHSSAPGGMHHPLDDDTPGVTYAVVRAIHSTDPQEHWHARLVNTMMGAFHLDWIRRALGHDVAEVVPPWSCLHNMRGSCFVTIHSASATTRSCWGAWDSNVYKDVGGEARIEVDTLAKAVRVAVHMINTQPWHDEQPMPISDDEHIEVTLIEPMDFWVDQQCVPPMGCRIRSGSTYIPSVWNRMPNTSEFIESLIQKNGGRVDDLQTYNCVIWTERGNEKGTQRV